MKEYRLSAWPELRPPFDRTAHRRILSNMSQRHVSLAQLVESSGLRRQEVRAFLDHLIQDELVEERDVADAADSLFGSLRPLGGWLRRAWNSSTADQ